MKKITLIIFSCFILFGCSQRQETTSFYEDKLFDNYLIKIPNVLYKLEEGCWTSSKENSHLFFIRINIVTKGDKTLKEELDKFIDEDTIKIDNDKILVSTDTINSNNFKGLIANYTKNINNKSVIPVNTYYTFAVIQNERELIRFKSLSVSKNYSDVVNETINSIKKNNPDTLKISDSANHNVNITKVDVKVLKKKGYQIFWKDNFAIKWNCILKINKSALKLAKDRGDNNLLSSYIGADKKDTYETGVICNVQINDIALQFENIPTNNYENTTKQYLNDYISKLSSFKINYKECEYKGLKAVEYTFSYMEMPSKAIIFVKDKKLYLLQISTRKDIQEKFNELKDSFTFINSTNAIEKKDEINTNTTKKQNPIFNLEKSLNITPEIVANKLSVNTDHNKQTIKPNKQIKDKDIAANKPKKAKTISKKPCINCNENGLEFRNYKWEYNDINNEYDLKSLNLINKTNSTISWVDVKWTVYDPDGVAVNSDDCLFLCYKNVDPNSGKEIYPSLISKKKNQTITLKIISIK